MGIGEFKIKGRDSSNGCKFLVFDLLLSDPFSDRPYFPEITNPVISLSLRLTLIPTSPLRRQNLPLKHTVWIRLCSLPETMFGKSRGPL